MKKDNLSFKVETIIKAIQAADIVEITHTVSSGDFKLWNRIELIDNNEYYISLIRPYGDDGETENNVILYESLDSATVENNQISVKDEDDQPVIIALYSKKPLAIF